MADGNVTTLHGGLADIDRARDDAQVAARETHNLFRAAMAIAVDNSDELAEACLKAASEKLTKLTSDLDSVNFGRARSGAPRRHGCWRA